MLAIAQHNKHEGLAQLPFPTQYSLCVVRMNNWPSAAAIDGPNQVRGRLVSSIGITRSNLPSAALKIATCPLKLIR